MNEISDENVKKIDEIIDKIYGFKFTGTANDFSLEQARQYLVSLLAKLIKLGVPADSELFATLSYKIEQKIAIGS
jgi:hypothetical protein